MKDIATYILYKKQNSLKDRIVFQASKKIHSASPDPGLFSLWSTFVACSGLIFFSSDCETWTELLSCLDFSLGLSCQSIIEYFMLKH